MFNTLRFITSHPLGRRDKWATVLRYLRWQIGSRIAQGPIAVDFINNTRLLVRPGMTGATGNIYCGLHEFEDMAFLLHFLRPSDLFVDIGANIGSYTILASAVIGAHGIAFEPVPQTFQSLIDNIHLNRIAPIF